MVNVEQITSRLSMMPDQALQQYAMMHKNDPYVLSLAVSESNRRKQMRAAAVPQAQEQPKVADQAVASMALPERQGIGSLPAEMNFADGGIVAFADGGDVASYAPGGVTRAQVDAAYQNWMSSQPSWFQQSSPMSAQREAAAKAEYERLLSQYQTQPSMIQPGGPIATTTSEADLAKFDADTQAYMAERAAKAQQAKVNAGLAGTPEAAALRAPAAGAPSIGGDMVSRAKKTASEIYDTSEQEKLLKEKQDLVNLQVAEINKRFAERPKTKAGEGLEALLKKEEEAEVGEKDRATGMAIFKAGLAMMSGTSPYALQNIGKGAMVGAEEYGSAIKEFKKAAKDRQKLMAEIEEKRRLQEMGDWEAASAKDDKIYSLQSGIKDKMIDATVKSTGVRAELAGGLIGKELDRQTQIAVKGMPSYSDVQERNLINMWLARPENKGKDDIDARMALGLAVGKGERPASPGEQLRAAEFLSQYGAQDDMATGVEVARRVAGVKPAATASSAKPTTKEQYDKLPKGSVYTAPDGTQRIKG